MAKRSSQMITSETHLPQPAVLRASSMLTLVARRLLRIQVPATRRNVPGRKRETIPSPSSISGVKKFSAEVAQWAAHVTQPGLGHVLSPKSITVKGPLWINQARPWSGGPGWMPRPLSCASTDLDVAPHDPFFPYTLL